MTPKGRDAYIFLFSFFFYHCRQKVDYESDGEEITELSEAFVHIDNLDYPKWSDTLVVRFIGTLLLLF